VTAVRGSTRLRRPNLSGVAPARGTVVVTALGLLAALAVAAASTWQPAAAVALVLGGIVMTWLAFFARERGTLILALLVLAMFTEGLSAGGVSADRLVSPIAVLFIIVAFIGGRDLPIGAPLQWVLLYSLWAAASGFWTADFGRTVTTLFSLGTAGVFMIAFALFVNSRAMLDRVLIATAGTAFVVGILGASTFLQGSAERTRGTIGDYNFFAAYELVALPLVLVLFSVARSRLAKAAAAACILAIIAAILTTLSRGGAISLVVVMLVALLWPARKLFRVRVDKAKLFLVAAVAIVGLVTIPSQQVLPRLTSVVSQKDKGSGRLNVWLAAKTTIRERPVLGLGYGGFLPASNDLMRRTPGVDLVDFDLRQRGLEPHNAFIGTTAELGFPGLILFCGMLLSTGLAFRRSARRASEVGAFFLMRVCNALLLGLIGWVVASLFLSSETNKPLWVMMGLALAMPRLIADAAAAEPSSDGARHRTGDGRGEDAPWPSRATVTMDPYLS
jgi:O-antigen ligase